MAQIFVIKGGKTEAAEKVHATSVWSQKPDQRIELQFIFNAAGDRELTYLNVILDSPEAASLISQMAMQLASLYS